MGKTTKSEAISTLLETKACLNESTGMRRCISLEVTFFLRKALVCPACFSDGVIFLNLHLTASPQLRGRFRLSQFTKLMCIKQHIINLKSKQNKHGRAATGNSLGCNKETVDCWDDTILLLLYKPLCWGHWWLCLPPRGANISKSSPGFPCVYCYLHIIFDIGKALVKKPFFFEAIPTWHPMLLLWSWSCKKYYFSNVCRQYMHSYSLLVPPVT